MRYRTRWGAVLTLSGVWLAAAGTAHAEIIVVDGRPVVRESTVARPVRGQTMRAVEERFGAPRQRHAAIGNPPITRWDYAEFSVYFEHDRVIHAVATS
ncbi:MAG: hypothetical protein NZM12_00565 [Steroidobacteraceae bacterium]|nr:hypothetical protein [Steroidobacteraceae bacterium]MDW8258752.1 hypothetical protein [Gammaproteobacteria bacterium]